MPYRIHRLHDFTSWRRCRRGSRVQGCNRYHIGLHYIRPPSDISELTQQNGTGKTTVNPV